MTLANLLILDPMATDASQPDPTPDPTPEPTPSPKPKDSANVGAIAGGSVGGVAFVALLVGIIFVFRRSWRRKAQSEDHHHSELPGDDQTRTIEDPKQLSPQQDSINLDRYPELNGDHPPRSTSPVEVHEMEAPVGITIPRKPLEPGRNDYIQQIWRRGY